VGAFTDLISKALPGFRGSTSVAPTVTAGTSAEDLTGSGYILTVEKSPRLRGRQRYITYRETVTNTLIVATGVRYFLNLIANAEWTMEPPKDENDEALPGAQDAADFVEDVLKDMESSWPRVVRRAARFRFDGFSWQEWTAKKREDGRIGLKDIEVRPCSTIERWDTDGGNSVMGVVQYVPGGQDTYLPRGKALYLVDDVLSDSPEGTGLIRHLVRDAERLRGYEDLEELAFETDLRGMPIGRAPLKDLRDQVDMNKMTLAQVKKARAVVDNFVRNKLLNKAKGAVLDSETFSSLTADGGTAPSAVRKWDVELLKGDSSHIDEANQAINRLNNEMARLLGIEHLMLGSDGTGSLALIGGKLSSFFLLVSSTLVEIAEASKRDVVGVICALNGIPKELWPTPTPAEIDVNDVAGVAQVLSSLATAGAPLVANDPAIDKVRSRVGLPPAPETPELSPEDQMLIARVRQGLPLPPEDPNAPGDPNAPKSKPKPGDKTGKDVKPGSEGSAQQQASSSVKKLLKTLLGQED
jgi:hypothetical protein